MAVYVNDDASYTLPGTLPSYFRPAILVITRIISIVLFP
jgi:hypothetical protein